METGKCCVRGCANNPMFFCNCQDPPLLVCESHALSHMQSGLGETHTMSALFAKLSDKEIFLLREAKSKIFEYKKEEIGKMTKEYSEKYSILFKEFLEKTEALVESVNPLIARLEIGISTNLALRSSTDEFLFEISKGVSFSEYKQNEYIDALIKKYIRRTQGLELSEVKQERFVYCPEKDTKKIHQIDNKNLTRKVLSFEELANSFGTCAGILNLEEDKIFYCGGNTKTVKLKNCYILNTVTRKIENLPNLPQRLWDVIPLQIGNFLYIFGGKSETGNLTCTALKFCLNERRWIELHKLPVSSSYLCCVSSGKSILIAGQETEGIYKFDESGYEKIFSAPKSHSLLLKNEQDQLFFLNSGEIYKSATSNCTEWSIVGSFNQKYLGYLENTPQLYEDYFCFCIEANQYRRFNYNTLVVDEPTLSIIQ